MRRLEPRGLFERASAACFTVLLAAVAVFFAVKLILAVLLPLLTIGGMGLLIACAAALVRARRNHW